MSEKGGYVGVEWVFGMRGEHINNILNSNTLYLEYIETQISVISTTVALCNQEKKNSTTSPTSYVFNYRRITSTRTDESRECQVLEF